MPYHEALLYIHILIALMLFALGIPTLIVETSAEDQIRHMLHKRLPYGLVTVLMVVTVSVIFGLLLVAVPEAPRGASDLDVKYSTADGSGEAAGPTVVMSDGKAGSGPQPLRSERIAKSDLRQGPATQRFGAAVTTTVIGRSGAGKAANIVRRRAVQLTIDGAAKVMVAVLVVAFSVLWWRMMKHDLRTHLVRVLRRQIIKRYERSGDFSDDDIRDLVALGSHAAAGHEKRNVILAMGDVCEAIQQSSRYGGAELGALLHGFKALYATPAKPGNDDNFMESLEVLREVWRRLGELGLRYESDARAAHEIVCWLGEHALDSGSGSAASHTLDVIAESLEVPFRIGRSALQRRRFTVAVACLNHLEALAESASRPPKELIALIACFHAAGPSATRRSRLAVHVVRLSAIRSAATQYYEIGDFGTSDLLQSFANKEPIRLQQVVSGGTAAAWIAAFAATLGIAMVRFPGPSPKRH